MFVYKTWNDLGILKSCKEILRHLVNGPLWRWSINYRMEALLAVGKLRNLCTRTGRFYGILRFSSEIRAGLGVDKYLVVQGSGGMGYDNYFDTFYLARVIYGG